MRLLFEEGEQPGRSKWTAPAAHSYMITELGEEEPLSEDQISRWWSSYKAKCTQLSAKQYMLGLQEQV